jgi:hypothetical protein
LRQGLLPSLIRRATVPTPASHLSFGGLVIRLRTTYRLIGVGIGVGID